MSYNNAFNSVVMDFFDVVGAEYCGPEFGQSADIISSTKETMSSGRRISKRREIELFFIRL